MLHKPHNSFCIHGTQSPGKEATFLKLDPRGYYRLWELCSNEIPLNIKDIPEVVPICIKEAIAVSVRVRQEIEARKKRSLITPVEKLGMARASRNIWKTVDPPG
jgi:hypothetical protein